MSKPSRFPVHGPELKALLAACHREPDDDTPRLVLADWLQERDDPRGELVRLQVRLAAMPANDPEYDALFGQHQKWWKKYGKWWEREVDTLIWDSGPHDRGRARRHEGARAGADRRRPRRRLRARDEVRKACPT